MTLFEGSYSVGDRVKVNDGGQFSGRVGLIYGISHRAREYRVADGDIRTDDWTWSAWVPESGLVAVDAAKDGAR